MCKEVILFDINETVLSLTPLKSVFTEVLGDGSMADLWFSMLLHSSTVCALTDVNTDFATLGDLTLTALTARMAIRLSDKQKAMILNEFAHLQAYADVRPALHALRSAGYQTVAFSNSSQALITAQLHHAGLTAAFSSAVSVEIAETFKPSLRAYQYAAERLHIPIAQLRLVSTHDWDLHGALSAGLQGAYIARSRAPYHPLFRYPDITGNSMSEIVSQIMSKPVDGGRV